MTADHCAPTAWLTRHDGTVVVGYGSLIPATHAPTHGVAFHLRDFGPGSDRPWRIPERHEIIDRSELVRRLPPQPILPCHWEPIDTIAFSRVFEEIMTSIRQGQFEKTVPVVTETGQCPDLRAEFLCGAMAACRPPLHSYGYLDGARGFSGATPELLVSLQGSRLRTMALAGTARSEDRDIFAVDEKEIREHQYVAQTLESKLHDLGALRREPREILDLGPIVHFLTRIHVELQREIAPEEMLTRLHPTPALGPLPRSHTTLRQLMEWRQRLGCPPGFGAPFGVWENGHFDALVAIRGVWWDGTQVQIPSGCGIIEASRMVNEWRELRLKREAVKQILGFC